jgi:glycosyltransferase involved in cell wall biosynthesis
MVDEELPYPPNSGKRVRTLNLTLRLARRHQITYVCHRNADPREAQRAELYFAEHGIASVVVDHQVPRKSGPAFYLSLAANLASPLPYSVATHRSAAMRKALRVLVANQTIDLWHCEWTPYAQSFRGLINGKVSDGRQARRLTTHHAPLLVMAHNIESLIWQRYYETEPHPLKRWYLKQQWRKFERFERRTLASVDRVVAVSDRDADRMARDFGTPHPEVVDNGVDTAYFRPMEIEREPAHILFLGSLDWRPNLDAVTVLLNEIFPNVQAAEPSAHLSVVGRNPPAWLIQQIRERAGVTLHANVADVRPYLARCGMLAVPLRIGGGSRLKILEALACETPVVSTRIGAEGLHLEPGQHLQVTDGPREVAGALIQCIRNPQWAQGQARLGRQRILERYDWDILSDKLEQVWLSCVRNDSHATTR